MDTKFTESMQAWLNADPAARSLEEGAKLVLRLTGNRYMYQNILVRKDVKMIEYQLNKYLPRRLAQVTHEDVARMKKAAAEIADRLHLDKPRKSAKSEAAEWKKGKRADHDTLPEDVQAAYAENLTILRRMRECHLQIRKMLLAVKPCTDCDVYPFVKELIDLDKRYRANWERYDSYGSEEKAE